MSDARGLEFTGQALAAWYLSSAHLVRPPAGLVALPPERLAV